MTETTTPARPEREAYELLTARERRFVDAIVQGRKRADAVRDIGYKGPRPQDAAYKMLRRPLIRQAVAEREALWQEGVDVSRAMIATELARVAFFDPRKMVDERGALKPLHELDDDTAAVVQSIEVQEEYEDGEEGQPRRAIGRTARVKVAGKVEALRELAGIYRMKGDDSGPQAGAVGPGLTVIVQQGVTTVVQANQAQPAQGASDTYEHLGLPPPER